LHSDIGSDGPFGKNGNLPRPVIVAEIHLKPHAQVERNSCARDRSSARGFWRDWTRWLGAASERSEVVGRHTGTGIAAWSVMSLLVSASVSG
jgi:hypothetical protein